MSGDLIMLETEKRGAGWGERRLTFSFCFWVNHEEAPRNGGNVNQTLELLEGTAEFSLGNNTTHLSEFI